jgi:hypothetical protein
MKTSSLWGGLALSLTLALAACGGGDDGGNEDNHHEAETIDSAGRLAVAEDAAAALRIYDLDSSSVVSQLALANPPSAVYASPGRRYALAFQRTQDTVQIADGGLWREDHGDHLHDYRAAPKLLGLRIDGPQPTHYDDRQGQASIFMDGRDPAVSSAVVFKDADLTAGRTGTGLSFALPMHGFAEPNGDFLVTSYRAPGSSGPTQLEVYNRVGTQYSFSRRFDTQCPSMHGSYTRGSVTVAGCADGVLVVSPQVAGAAAATKISTATGVSTVAGHPNVARVIGIGNSGTPSTTRFHEIDMATGTSAPIALAGWTEGRLRRAHGFNRDGRYFYVLDDLGTLHVLERGVSGWTTVKSIAAAIPSMPTAAPFPALVANEARDEVYLSDPNARQLVVVNTATQTVARRASLDFRPSYLAWLGIAR